MVILFWLNPRVSKQECMRGKDWGRRKIYLVSFKNKTSTLVEHWKALLSIFRGLSGKEWEWDCISLKIHRFVKPLPPTGSQKVDTVCWLTLNTVHYSHPGHQVWVSRDAFLIRGWFKWMFTTHSLSSLTSTFYFLFLYLSFLFFLNCLVQFVFRNKRPLLWKGTGTVVGYSHSHFTSQRNFSAFLFCF